MGILDPAKLTAVMKRESRDELEDKAEAIKANAISVYMSERQLPNHNQYVSSFEVHVLKDSAVVYNPDSETIWVEYGVHAGGKTPVLGYAPLRRAIDAEASLD